MALFKTPEYTLIGSKALEEAKPYLKKCGKKALIVTGKHVVLSDMMAELKKALEEIGIAYFVFDGITGEPTNVMIDEGIAAYKENGCDFCIGIGGGSPLDSAKAIAAMITNEGKIADYNGKVIEKPIPPVGAIPTTAGTGSEATQFTVITDVEKDIKMLLKGGYLVPKIAIVDPAYTYSAPKSITAATGMDALTHAVEAYIGNSTTPGTRKDALMATELIFNNLDKAYTNGSDTTARKNMLKAAYYAGCAFTKSYVGYVHAVAHSLGGEYNVPHGLANAVILPMVLESYGESIYTKLHDLAIAAGVADKDVPDETAAKAFIQAVKDMKARFNIGDTIPEIKEKDIPKLAGYADKEANPLYPVPVLMDAKTLEQFYYKLMKDNTHENEV